MVQGGFVFFVTANEVWLIDVVPPPFIGFSEDQTRPHDRLVTGGAEPPGATIQRNVAYVSSRSSGLE